jgi:hypothetical protein
MEAVTHGFRQPNHGKIMGKIWGNGDLTNKNGV